MTVVSQFKADGLYRQAKDRDARALEAPVDRIDLIREAVRNLARRETPMPCAKASLGAQVAREAAPLPPLPPEQRRRKLQAAIAYLGQRGVMVWTEDREALIRKYRVTGRRDLKLAEDVIAIAAEYGFEVQS